MRQLSKVVMAGIGAGLYVACAPALAADYSGVQAAAAGEVEAPENPIHTPTTDDAAPPSVAPKTVVPDATTKTIHVSPEKARELKATGTPKTEPAYPGNSDGQ